MYLDHLFQKYVHSRLVFRPLDVAQESGFHSNLQAKGEDREEPGDRRQSWMMGGIEHVASEHLDFGPALQKLGFLRREKTEDTGHNRHRLSTVRERYKHTRTVRVQHCTTISI